MRRLAWWGAVAAGLAVGHAAGRGPLAVASPASWAAWTAIERAGGPVVVIASVLRLGVLAAGVYLAVLLALAELARLPVAGRHLLRLLAAVPVGRVVATQLLGAVVTVGAVTPAFADPAPVMHVVGHSAPQMSMPAPAPLPLTPAPQMEAPPTTAAPTIPPDAAQGAPPPPAAGAPTDTPGAAAAGTRAPTPPPGAPMPNHAPAVPSPTGPATAEVADAVVLARGDSLWSAAEAHLRAVLGRAPAPAEVGAYWWRVVEANRARLADPADPSFVLPGFVVTLPPAS